jgi:hypothetical protein
MKTVEETLKKHLTNFGTPVYHRFFHKDILEAMKAYALAAIQEDRKDCAEKIVLNLFEDGITLTSIRETKSSILDRPLPELK